MVADVKPGPTVKAARLNMTNVVRNKIFAELVSFISTHPQLARPRAKCDTNGVANSPGENLPSRTVRIKFENAGTIRLGGIV